MVRGRLEYMSMYERSDFEVHIQGDRRLGGASPHEVLAFADAVMGDAWERRMKPKDLADHFISYGETWRENTGTLRAIMAQLLGNEEAFKQRILDEESATAEGLSIVPTRELYDLYVLFTQADNEDPAHNKRGYKRETSSYEEWCEDMKYWQTHEPDRLADFNYMWRKGYATWKREFEDEFHNFFEEQMKALNNVFGLDS